MSQMPSVSATYGAPMGRDRGDSRIPARKVRLFRVRINSGGYDDGGAYWGLGQPLYCATDDLDYTQYIRGVDRFDAAMKFQEQLDQHMRGLGRELKMICWAVKVS